MAEDFKIKFKPNSRPFSNIDKQIQYCSNKTFSDFKSNPLNIKINQKEKGQKINYINISHRNINNSFSKALQQKKLFYNKLYNKNYGSNDKQDKYGLSEFIQIRREQKVKTPFKIRDLSSTKLSSTTTYRKINLKSKNFQKNKKFKSEEIKSCDISYDMKKDKFFSLKKDKIMQINDEELEQIYIKKNKTNSKARPISVSTMFLSKEKSMEKNIEIKLEEIQSGEMKLKNLFIIKYGYILDLFQKALSNSDWFRLDFRTTFINITKNLLKSYEVFYKLLLDKISEENCLQSLYLFCEEIISWQKLTMEEIRFLKKENINLSKRQKFSEKELITKKEELNEINEKIIKYDLNKVKKGKTAELEVKKIKNDFINQESTYINTIYQKKNEIKELNKVLEKYKQEKLLNDELKIQVKQLREELAENKAVILKNDFNQKQKDKLTSIYIEELSLKIDDFDQERNTWKEKESQLQEEIVNLKTKFESINHVLKEKDIMISELQKHINEIKDNSYLYGNLKYPVNTKFMSEQK